MTSKEQQWYQELMPKNQRKQRRWYRRLYNAIRRRVRLFLAVHDLIELD